MFTLQCFRVMVSLRNHVFFSLITALKHLIRFRISCSVFICWVLLLVIYLFLFIYFPSFCFFSSIFAFEFEGTGFQKLMQIKKEVVYAIPHFL